MAPLRFFSLLPVLCAAFLIISDPAAARAETPASSCNDYMPASIRVEQIFDDVVLESVPMLKIREVADSSHGDYPEQWPVGLASAQAILKVQTDIYKIRSGYNQHTCGQIKTLAIQIGFKDNKILVAKEFPRRSCPYRTVVEHEQKHKDADRALLAEFADKSRMIFADMARKIGVIKTTVPTMIEEQINEQVALEIDRLGKELEEERNMRQRAIDSPEEYKRVSDSCDGRTMETVHDRLELLENTHPGITKSVFHPGSEQITR